jgi:hypothetical protein
MALGIGDLAWTAGVIDMKGKLVRKKNKMRVSPQVVLWVETKDMTIIRGLSALTGTNPELMKPPEGSAFNRRSCSEHCPEPHVHVENSWPSTARWTISGLSLGVLLWNVQPYTRSGKPWQETITEMFGNAVVAGRGSGATVKSLNRLASLGWEIPPAIRPVLEVTDGPDDDEGDSDPG